MFSIHFGLFGFDPYRLSSLAMALIRNKHDTPPGCFNSQPAAAGPFAGEPEYQPQT